MVEAEGAHGTDSEEVVGGAEAARGHIAFVLDGVVAAGRREICGAASVVQSGHARERGVPWTMMGWRWKSEWKWKWKWKSESESESESESGSGAGGRCCGGSAAGGVVRRKVTRMRVAAGASARNVCHSHSMTNAMEVSMHSEQPLPAADTDLDSRAPDFASVGKEEKGEEAAVPMGVAADGLNPISKNQRKKLARLQHYADTREQWKTEKRDKKKAAKERKRQAQSDRGASTGLKRKADGEENEAGDGVGSADSSVEGSVEEPAERKKQKTQPKRVLEPITLIMDCGFDEKMNDKVCQSSLPLSCGPPMLTSAVGNHFHVLSAHALLRLQPSLDAPGLPPRHLPQRPTPSAPPNGHQQPASALEERQVLRHGLRDHRREQGRSDIPDGGLARHGRGPGGWQDLHYRRNRR